MKYHIVGHCSAIAMMFAANSAYAQTDSPTPSAPADVAATKATATPQSANNQGDRSQIEDIIVTAERRTTDVQHTALAITALAGGDLMNSGVNSAAGLVAAVPGVAVNTNIPIQNIFIRGVGGGIVNNYGDPAVSYNVDGVYIQRPFGGPSGTYFDLDRVEILKGPQGTLYGRNATVGAANVITRAPTFDFGGNIGGEFGNYGNVQTNGALNLPISDTVATRFAFKTNYHDGYLTNGFNDARSVAGRASILFKPNSDLSLRVTADYFHDTSKGIQTIFIYQANNNQKYTVPGNPWFGTKPPGCAITIQCPTIPSTYLTTPFGVTGNDANNDNKVWSVKAELNYNLGPATLTVIPAYVDSDINYRFYSGGFVGDAIYRSKQYSLEARLASNNDGPLKWVAGAFYYAERQNSSNQFLQPSGFFVFSVPHQKDTSYAFFGQATYSITDSFRLTGGLRYTNEVKSQDGTTLVVNVPPPTCLAAGATLVPGPEIPPRCQVLNSGRLSASNVSWKAGVEFDAGSRSLLYANVSTGFKAGGLYMGAPPNTYRPEKITSYQIGTKNRFFDNKLQVNLEAFYWDYRDQQIYTFANVRPAGFASYPVNANGWLKGVELNVVALPTPNDRVTIDLVYEDGKYTKYDNPGATLFIPPATNIVIVPASTLKNVERPAIPKLNGTVSYQHTFDISSGGNVAFNVSAHFETGAWFDLTHRRNSYRDAYAMGDARLTYNAPEDKWSVTAFVNNFTNAAVVYGGSSLIYSRSAAYVPPNPDAWTVSIFPPRTYGLRFNANF